MRRSGEQTEQLVRELLAELWPEAEVETESLGDLVILSVRPPGVAPEIAPELRLSWTREEGHVLATVYQTPSSVRVDEPSGEPRLVVEAAVRRLRAMPPAAGR